MKPTLVDDDGSYVWLLHSEVTTDELLSAPAGDGCEGPLIRGELGVIDDRWVFING
jgi:hypothetical protein